MREVRGADAIGFLRRFGRRARGQERVAAHVGRFVDEEGRPRPAALQPREGARRARVEDGDPHVGRDLIEPIAQRAVRIAVVAEQQALFVGVPGVVDEHFGAAAAAPDVRRASATRALSRSSASTSSWSFGCLRTISLAGVTPPRSTSTRAKRSASETAYCRRGRSAPPEFAPMTSVNRCTGAAAAARLRPGPRPGRAPRTRTTRAAGRVECCLHGLTSFCSENVDCVSSRQGSRAPLAATGGRRAAARRAASRIGATANGASPVTK